MPYHVKEGIDQTIWNQFLATVTPDTFLHSWEWGVFNEATGTSVARFGVYEEDRLVAIALILTVRARRGTFLFCPHGPLISTSPDNGSATTEIIRALTAHLKAYARQQNAIFIRISPLLMALPFNQDAFVESGYRNAPIHMAHPELAWILNLEKSEDELLKEMRKSTRYSIKKAEKDGVTISASTNPADIETFWRVYETTVSRQHFTPFSKEYLAKEFEIFSRNHGATFFFAHYHNEITAAALVIHDNHSGYYHHGATTQKYPGLTDAQLLQWEIIKALKKKGVGRYNFWGVVPETATSHPWYGLSVFKRGFGGREYAYVHAQDLALSPRYYLTYVIEFLRRKKRHL